MTKLTMHRILKIAFLEYDQLLALYCALNDWIEEANFASLLRLFHVLAPW